MRLYKPTIYRTAAQEVLEGMPYACISIGLAFAQLASKNWSKDYRAGQIAVEEFASFFEPETKPAMWFDFDTEHRILSLLLMAEITKGQYFTIP